MAKPIVVGAVLYDPKVAVIWEIIGGFFEANGCPIDTVFYSNYELQVEALLRRQIDVAWNSPLAWLDAQRRSNGGCRAIAMRDTDRDRASQLIVRTNGGIAGLADIRGKTVAVGAKDSPQATLIPLGLLLRHGLEPGRDFQVKRFDVLVGKHGDHIGGELDAFTCLDRGEADVAALLDLNWNTWTSDGTIDPGTYRILASTERFDHCVFTVRQDMPAAVQQRWLDVLFSMSYDNPGHREMMDLEGLKQWLPGRVTGFGPLSQAVVGLHFFESGKA
ncbi:MAG TPA: phosphate/phosphite/phosphonate ABC transporter substrate-binding protein [Chloroflexota bacterium]|nr:phosphate/phosphite/phosphonate ABC transporter substrate-binding protein [Chloroflexota bacterium]